MFLNFSLKSYYKKYVSNSSLNDVAKFKKLLFYLFLSCPLYLGTREKLLKALFCVKIVLYALCFYYLLFFY